MTAAREYRYQNCQPFPALLDLGNGQTLIMCGLCESEGSTWGDPKMGFTDLRSFRPQHCPECNGRGFHGDINPELPTTALQGSPERQLVYRLRDLAGLESIFNPLDGMDSLK